MVDVSTLRLLIVLRETAFSQPSSPNTEREEGCGDSDGNSMSQSERDDISIMTSADQEL